MQASWQLFERGFMAWFEPHGVFVVENEDAYSNYVVQWTYRTERWAEVGSPHYDTGVERGFGYVYNTSQTIRDMIGAPVGTEWGGEGEIMEFDDGGYSITGPNGSLVHLSKPEPPPEPEPTPEPAQPCQCSCHCCGIVTEILPSGRRRNLSFYRGANPVDDNLTYVTWVGYRAEVHPNHNATLFGEVMEPFTGKDAKAILDAVDSFQRVESAESVEVKVESSVKTFFRELLGF